MIAETTAGTVANEAVQSVQQAADAAVSQATAEATKDIASRIADRGWREDSNRMHTMVNLLGHPGIMIDKIQKQNAIQRMGMRALQRGSATVDPKLDGDPKEDDPMAGVNIGNEITNNYNYDDRDVQPQALPAPPPATPLWQKALPWIASGLGAAGLTWGLMKEPAAPTKPTPPPASSPFSDSDTRSQIGIEVHD